jgi:hypothetical protein
VRKSLAANGWNLMKIYGRSRQGESVKAGTTSGILIILSNYLLVITEVIAVLHELSAEHKFTFVSVSDRMVCFGINEQELLIHQLPEAFYFQILVSIGYHQNHS